MASFDPTLVDVEMVIIDIDGNVILDVGGSTDGGSKHIRVSSEILRRASPTFSAMLSPRFREGVNLRSELVRLPEDDPDSIVFLFNIIYGRVDPALEQVDFETLRKLAIVSDKYFCGRAISEWTASCFDRLIGETTTSSRLVNAVLLTYALDSPQAFRRATELAIRYHVGPINCTIKMEGLDMIPTHLLGRDTYICKIAAYPARYLCLPDPVYLVFRRRALSIGRLFPLTVNSLTTTNPELFRPSYSP
jgi:hypothetical protein